MLPAEDRERENWGTYFKVARAKTGTAAAGALSQWSAAVLDAYVAKRAESGVEHHSKAPLLFSPRWRYRR